MSRGSWTPHSVEEERAEQLFQELQEIARQAEARGFLVCWCGSCVAGRRRAAEDAVWWSARKRRDRF